MNDEWDLARLPFEFAHEGIVCQAHAAMRFVIGFLSGLDLSSNDIDCCTIVRFAVVVAVD